MPLKSYTIAFSLLVAVASGSITHATETAQGLDAASAQRVVDVAAAPIHSDDELYAYRSLTPKSQSPLELLSPGAQQRFLSSLRFNENGLVSFNYTDLRAELTPLEIHKVLSLFGAQRLTAMAAGGKQGTSLADRAAVMRPALKPDDHENYRCAGEHTCSHSTADICMSGC